MAYSGSACRTTDGGNTWTCQSTGFSPTYSIFFTPQGHGWVCGSNGTIMHTLIPIGITPISNEVPTGFRLYQNYPNPFNPVTKIKFDISAVAAVHEPPYSLRIYDVLGREVATLVNESLKPGTYEVEFDGTNYPSGVYYYKLIASDYTDSKKMVLVK